MEDYRIPSVHALINGVTVPHLDPPFMDKGFTPRHLSIVPVYRERSRSPISFRYSDATTVESSSDSGSMGFEIVPVAPSFH